MSKRLAALVAAAILGALALARPAQATTRGSPDGGQAGRIVWTQGLDDQFSAARIVSARPDGSGLRVLTHPGPGDFDINAVVSPDGSRVLFERDLPDGRSVLVMVGADGQGAHTVPVSCADPCAGVHSSASTGCTRTTGPGTPPTAST